MARSWYVLRVEPRAEYLAAAELGRDQFEIFFPRVNSPHHRIGRPDTPLFPGYLFLRCDPQAGGWPTFRLAHRVAGWVSFGGVIPPIPDDVMIQLARRVAEINEAKGLWRRFRQGETVQVVSNSIQGLAQVVEEAKSPQARAKVLLEFMGRMVQAQVPWGHLRAIEDNPREPQRVPRRTRGGGRWIRGYGPSAAGRDLA